MKTLVVIPARGGSKGIPRKSLRPLAGAPLISYAIKAALQAKGISAVVVTTDDDEMALFAKRFGAQVVQRGEDLSSDLITLDPVIIHAHKMMEERDGVSYDVVLTVQPTSPLITPDDIEKAIDFFEQGSDVDTVLSVVDDRHLRWENDNGKLKPAYQARVNRQLLPPMYRETGAVIACRRHVLATGTRIGANVKLQEIPYERSFDIDSVYDWYVCENILKKKRIVFNVVGYPEVGLGHAYRAVMLANELVFHEIIFVIDGKSKLAAEYVTKFNYRVILTAEGDVLNEIARQSPDLLINDVLDTDIEFIRSVKSLGSKIVNFEDLGEGAKAANLVINALYASKDPGGHILSGPEYFCLRDEFLYAPLRERKRRVECLLITFGGVDEGNLTSRILGLIANECLRRNIKIKVVVGPGFKHHELLANVMSGFSALDVDVVSSTTRISDYMLEADLAITSGGRTVLELAAMKVPALVVCQNERETTHTFASEKYGVCNLGLRTSVSDLEIVNEFIALIEDNEKREGLLAAMEEQNLAQGKRRVISLINNLLD